MARLKSICYYTQSTNSGTEYAIREDGKVFVREGFFNGRFWTKTKWVEENHDGVLSCFKGLPDRITIGFIGSHTKVESTRLRLPQD